MTQQQAADAAGWSVAQWGGMERGTRPDPQVSTMAKVAKVLNCRVDDLLAK
ncbi:MAG: helix-turn-helix transcriptional regulator [Phycisphaerae bacterium]|nr:helix-turn-helix transcriptional regulator [Phycisphaerae bacterium]